MRATVVFSIALLSIALFAILLSTSEVLQHEHLAAGTRRLQAAETAIKHAHIRWGPKQTAALILSILVSLTSSLDRECGASLYVVLFAVLLNMSFRKAAAMTAFTVALGALAPGIASMSEPRLTERGVLPAVDYPGALVLLPTMYWGISFGAIVNLVFPNWALALLWVIAMFASNLELLISFIKYVRVKKEAAGISEQLRLLSPPVSSDGTAAGTAGIMDVQRNQQEAVVGMSRSDVRQQSGELLNHAQRLAKRAHRIEARALLYPTLYVPDVGRALQKADIDINPCSLRATATPSCLGAMDFEQERLASELRSYQQVFGRFTFSWRKWWTLNRFHFEMSMVLKVVVLHLVTEAIRHHLSKPCTKKFWFMLCVMTGLVTAFLLYIVSCYTRRRLWRGPHWVDALNQVRQIKKQEQMQELQALQAVAGKDSAPNSPVAKAGPSAANIAAAVAAGDAVAVELSSSANGSHNGAATVPGTAAAAGDSTQRQQQQQQDGQEEAQPGCWPRFKSHLPWVWVKAPEALCNISNCNSYNSYRHWKVSLIIMCAAATMPIGIFGCALGLPGGPMMAQLLLLLGLKSEVVAPTSRFLVLCFTFGSFVAHIISGGMEPTLAAAFGLLNLGMAPLGMFLVTKVQPRGVFVIGLSLVMGVAGLVIVTVWQLVPLMAALITQNGGSVSLPLPVL